MIRDLLSRLCAGLRTPKWLNLPLLIAMLMPLCTHAAALPDGAPDYEFSVDNVTYKCYYHSKENSRKYYSVYALPENTGIKHASIRLDWHDGLSDYIPSDEPGYIACEYNNPATQLVSGEWEKCKSLKWIELLIYNWSDEITANTTDLSPLSNMKKMYIFITNQFYRSYPAYHVFQNRDLHHTIVNCCGKVYDSDKSAENIITDNIYLWDFAPTLVNVKTFEKNTAVCNDLGLSPKVELFGQGDSQLVVTYDEHGKVIEPLIGYCGGLFSINELKGSYYETDGLGGDFGEDIFKECIDIQNKDAYETAVPNEDKIAEYGYSSVAVYCNNVLIEKNKLGEYILPNGRYDFTFNYNGFKMRKPYQSTANTPSLDDVSVKLQLEWMPHGLKAHAVFEPDIPGLYGLYGISYAQYNSYPNFVPVDQYVPFDENGNAFLISNNRFSFIKDSQLIFHGIHPQFAVFRISKGFQAIGEIYDDYIAEDWACPAIITPQKIELYFDKLYDDGLLKPTDKIGVIYDNTKYYATANSSYDHCVFFNDFLPSESKEFSAFYEIDGTEYIYDFHPVMPTLTSSYSLITKTQSAKVIFKIPEDKAGYDSSLGDIVFGDLAVYRSGKKMEDVEVEQTEPMTFNVFNLDVAQDYELRGYWEYRRKSDGKTSNRTKIKVLFKSETPKWTSGSSQAMTTTKARLIYETNLENVSETYVEWRRVDAPDVVQSNKAACPVVDGCLVGILNNLNPDVYYKFRPIYEANDTKYIGEWIGIFTGDANVWFDPEINTRPARVRKDGSVTLQGSVVPGSGDISEQGFEVWPNGGAQHAPGNGVESSHTFIKCNGISISTELTDLKQGVTYTYRAYAKVDGQMYTGSEETFTIPGESGIDDVLGDAEVPTIIGYYNLQGHRSDRPFPGLNIVVYSNGRTEKRIIRE